ncbi:MAG TPA: hypothetical protein VI756_15425 [Blastocatellia bacterium]
MLAIDLERTLSKLPSDSPVEVWLRYLDQVSGAEMTVPCKKLLSETEEISEPAEPDDDTDKKKRIILVA